MSRIEGKNIVLGVSGGIAAYKSCQLVRELVREGADVRVVMTQNARKFVAPLTFQTLSGNPVAGEASDLDMESEIGHINIADNADLIVLAPATANLLAKASCGMADDLLTTVLLAATSPVIVCPAMNVNMYENPVVQENIERLLKRGYIVLEPEEGELACGWTGRGRLPTIEAVVEHIEKALGPKDMTKENILVTAGATREYLDSVRFISNSSTGRMGYAIARGAWLRGAEVLLVSGHSELPTPTGVEVVRVVSAGDMYEAVMSRLDWATVVIKAAAVGDYAPTKVTSGKIKKGKDSLIVELKRTRDILAELGRLKDGKIVVGFAAETENVVENAKVKLREKNSDLIVANDVTRPGSGFGADTNAVHLIYADGRHEELPEMSKSLVADQILDKVLELRSSKN